MKINTFFILIIIQFVERFMGSPILNTYMEGPVRFCGQRLAVEVSILCKGKYNEARGSGYRHKRGIVDECCYAACTRQYVKTYYCGPESTEPIITKPVETTTTTTPAKIEYKAKRRTDLFGYLFNIGWGVGEKVGLISIPEDRQLPQTKR